MKPYQIGHMLFKGHENNPKKLIEMAATEKHNLIVLVYKKQL